MRTIIKNVHVFDGENPNLLESRNIVVEDRLVTDIFAGTFSEEGFDRITLNVWNANLKAYGFYETMGLKPLETIMEDLL